VLAGGLQALAAEDAGAVRPGERGDDEVALGDRGDGVADLLDDADELVAHRGAPVALGHSVPGVQVAAADAGADDADDRVGGVDQGGLGDVDDAHVAGAVHVGSSHERVLLRGDG